MIESLYNYRIDVTRVIDGDTFEANVDLGYNVTINNITFRVHGIDTPENRGSEKELGLICKDFLQYLVTNSQKNIIIKSLNLDSFGRWLCELTLIYNNQLTDYAELCVTLGIDKKSPNYHEQNVLDLRCETYDY